MNNVVKTIKEYGMFMIATVEGDQPRVRPFGSITEINGKGYLCSNNTKDFHKQVKANPKVELSAMGKDGSWIRVSCKLIEVEDIECKRIILEDPTGPKSIYKEPTNPIFTIYRMDDVDCRKYTFVNPVEKIAE